MKVIRPLAERKRADAPKAARGGDGERDLRDDVAGVVLHFCGEAGRVASKRPVEAADDPKFPQWGAARIIETPG
jgi:hypothetical protein